MTIDWQKLVREAAARGTFQNLNEQQMATVGATLDVVDAALTTSNASLICPDDATVIRMEHGSEVVGGTVATLTEFEVELEALGVGYCLNLGLSSDLLVGIGVNPYTLEVIRAGRVVATYSDAMLAPTTANSNRATMCPQCVCVGPIQAVTLRWTFSAAAAAGAEVSVQVCRDFNSYPGCGAGAKSCNKGC